MKVVNIMQNFAKTEIDNKVILHRTNNSLSILLPNATKVALVDYDSELLEIIKKARFRVPENEEQFAKYKYPFSNEYNKTLHQIVFDFYFGEEIRKEAYSKDYIIEHLDNNGFNCSISNLFLLKKIKNTYKGWNFDKNVESALLIASLRIFHIISNNTFQITIGFNENYSQKFSGKILNSVKLLYPYNYEIVLQDAEQIIESILNRENISFEKWNEVYRFKDIRIEYAPDLILTEDEKKLPPGSFISRNGQYFLLVGHRENSFGLIDKVPYDENWDL